MANVLIANSPQLVISFLYLIYNSAFTSMVSANEYAKFGSRRKALRVSKPKGSQCSTFWLQLPYRYILPLMTAMAFLHWLISRSVFLLQLKFNEAKSLRTSSDLAINACGYSPLAILLALILGGIMIFGLFGMSLRKLDPGVPVAGSCSLAISAAAHPSSDEDKIALLPLMYGHIKGEGPRNRTVNLAGFSSKEVSPMIDGARYA